MLSATPASHLGIPPDAQNITIRTVTQQEESGGQVQHRPSGHRDSCNGDQGQAPGPVGAEASSVSGAAQPLHEFKALSCQGQRLGQRHSTLLASCMPWALWASPEGPKPWAGEQ